MKSLRSLSFSMVAIVAAALFVVKTQGADDSYKIVQTSQLMGTGGIDYVTADGANRTLYVPRSPLVLTFNLDTLEPETPIPGLMGGHGVAVDPVSNHGFSSSNPILMWDAKTLKPIKTITPQGRPDGILFEPLTERIYVLSHVAPNVTVIDGTDGSIVGTIDLGGAPEQAQSDGQGHVYIDLEDKNSVAVVDAKTMKLITTYSLGGKGGGPGGLGLDAKNNVLFAFCHEPAVAVILSATDGKILDTQPIGSGVDGGGFNPATMEAFSSQGDGTLTIIKENGPTSFAVEQTVQTLSRAKTCTLDTQKNHIIVVATERPAPSPGASPVASATPSTTPAPQGSPGGPGGPGGLGGPGGPGGRRGGGNFYRGPAILHILVVGKS
jgi:DNA-binding beta-propeller fold protein YncE